MDTTRIHEHEDTLDAYHSCLERPHGCYSGLVFIGHMVEDSEAGEEVEVFEAVPCRRCVKS